LDTTLLGREIASLNAYIHTSGSKYLLAKINRTVSGVQERYNKYAYRMLSTTYGILLSIDFLVCIFAFKENESGKQTLIAKSKSNKKVRERRISESTKM